MVTGSVAGIVQGVVRATQDIDVVVELPRWRVSEFVRALGPEFDVDEESLAEPLGGQRSWNIFHAPTMTRIDLFALKDEPLAVASFRRRRLVKLDDGSLLPVLAPEDLIIQKLRWYRAGGEGCAFSRPTTSRHWFSETTPRPASLERAARLGEVTDLLERVRASSATR